jgi:hypothetical protein
VQYKIFGYGHVIMDYFLAFGDARKRIKSMLYSVACLAEGPQRVDIRPLLETDHDAEAPIVGSWIVGIGVDNFRDW